MNKHFTLPRHFWRKLVFTILAGWLCFLVAVSSFYTYNLTHPGCIPAKAAQPGYQAVEISTADGIRLRGWWRSPQNGAVILLLGGSGANRDAMLSEAAFLTQNGYGILTLEARSCAGEPVSLGYHEAQDALAMLAYAQSQPGVEWIGILGFSAGGTAALHAAALDPAIQAVVAQGNYSSLLHEVTNDGSRPLSFQWQVNQAVLLALWLQLGIWPGQLNPLDDLAHIDQPVLLIHGELEADNNQASLQYAAANHPAQLWIVPDTGHGGYQLADPQGYANRILTFFNLAYKPWLAQHQWYKNNG